ncbi:lariocidin/triculamin family lasso peptide core domain [Streptomyces sp. WMMC940]|nr:hypothetical protein [Streptomyces sp. WMMC940]MCZ7458233.1 hypothetical protein [Streptomyces sp. WMMC940]
MSKKSHPGDGGHGLGAKGFGFIAEGRGLRGVLAGLVRAVKGSRTA